MNFECKCTTYQKMIGDGCQICDTEAAIDYLPQPVELAEQLTSQGFSEDQASTVAEHIFQPLVSLIATLNNKIDQLAKKL